MKILIVDDDRTSFLLLQGLLKTLGTTDIAKNGQEAVNAVQAALDAGLPYDLICLDIMMPEMDGRTALARIRELEDKADIGGLDRVKIIMTTALNDKVNVFQSFRSQCDGYVIKPVDREKLFSLLASVGLKV